MNRVEVFLNCGVLAFQATLCGFLYARRAHRVLPLFTAYGTMMLATTIGILIVYIAEGTRSGPAYYTYWICILVIAGMRSFAIAELCRYKLRAYRGIWSLAWRVLACLSILFILHAAIDTWGQPNALAIYALTLDIDLDLASVAILVALLFFHNYYRLSLEPLQRTIAAGICLICAVDIVSDTILRNFFAGPLLLVFTDRTTRWHALVPLFDKVAHAWNVVHISCFMATIGIWCYGLRKPVVAPAEAPELLPGHVYRELSPAINLRLSTFNDKLAELLKP